MKNQIKIHILKAYPVEFLDAIKAEVKTFEVRFNDRDFQVGDYLLIIAWDGEKYDYLNHALVKVTYILKDYAPAVGKGHVVMSIVYQPGVYPARGLVRQVMDSPESKLLIEEGKFVVNDTKLKPCRKPSRGKIRS